MNEKRHFKITLNHFKNYLLGDIATKAVAFFSIPIYTKILPVNDYGALNVFLSYISIFFVLFTLNCHSSISRYMYENRRDKNEYIGTVLLLVLVIFIFASFILLLYREKLSALLHLDPLLFPFIIPLVFSTIIRSIFVQISQPLRKSKQVAITGTLQSLIVFTITIILITKLEDRKYIGAIYSRIIVLLLFSILYIKFIIQHSKISLKWEHFKYILIFSIPLLPKALSGVILSQFDRVMIQAYTDSGDAGLYSLGYNIGFLMHIFDNALLNAWTPDYYKKMNKKYYSSRDSDIVNILKLNIIFGTILILFNREIGILILSESYHDGLTVIPIVVIGYIFLSLYSIYSKNIGYKKATIHNSIIVLIAGVMNIILNSIYIPKYGYIAGAYTTVISYFLMALLAWIVSKYILKTSVTPLKSLAPILFVFSIVIFFNTAIQRLSILNIFTTIILKIIFLILVIIILSKIIKNRKSNE